MKITDNMARKFLVLILLALFAIGAHAAQVTHFMASGDFANAFWVGATPGINSQTFVDAQRTDNSTLLIITVFSFDTTTFNLTILSGFGLVPGANLSVNHDMATISTEIANDPGFTLTSTVFDEFGNIISQTTISSGAINISLKKNQFLESTSFTGVSGVTSRAFNMRQEQDQTSASASASGSFLGSALPSDASGSIGFNRFNQITINKN